MRDTKPLEPLGPGDDLGPYRIHRRLRSPPGTELYQVGDRRNPEILLMRLEVFVPDLSEVDFFPVRWDWVRLFTRFMHPRVLRLFEVGSEGRRFYAAMPWISARSLLACLEDDRGVPWPMDAALSAGRDIALGLGGTPPVDAGWALHAGGVHSGEPREPPHLREGRRGAAPGSVGCVSSSQPCSDV